MDDDVFEARLSTFKLIVNSPSVTPGEGVEVPGKGAMGQGSIAAARAQLALSPDGSMYVSALDTVIRGLELRAPSGGIRILLEQMEIAGFSLESFGTAEAAAQAVQSPGFSKLAAGDTIIGLRGVQALAGKLLIDFAALFAEEPTSVPEIPLPAAGAAPETPAPPAGIDIDGLLNLLNGVNGSISLSLQIELPLGAGLPPLSKTVRGTARFRNGRWVVNIPPETIFGVVDTADVFEMLTGLEPSVELPVADFIKLLVPKSKPAPALPSPPPEMAGKNLSDALEILDAEARGEPTGESDATLDAIKKYVMRVVLIAARLLTAEVTTQNLRWKDDRIQIGDVDLTLQWGAAQKIPVQLSIKTGGGAVGVNGGIFVRAFTLDQIYGDVMGIPFWMSNLTLKEDMKLSGNVSVDPVTFDVTGVIEAPLSGLGLDELRILLAKSVPDGGGQPK